MWPISFHFALEPPRRQGLCSHYVATSDFSTACTPYTVGVITPLCPQVAPKRAAAMQPLLSHFEALHPTSPGKGSPKKATILVPGGEHAHPAPVFAKVGKKRFEVSAGYGGSMKADHEMCNDMWLVVGRCTLQELLANLFD